MVVALVTLLVTPMAGSAPRAVPTGAAKPEIADGATPGRHSLVRTAGGLRTAAMAAPSPDVLRLALDAARCAVNQGLVEMPPTLTVIDYSRRSTERRLWVFDLATGELQFDELVAHGRGSGGNLPTRFSNEPDSHQTSLGLFVTRDTYTGSNGYSLRLHGLEPGTNDRALERAIVMHGAPYVNERTAAALGRLGRSWGCPALREAVARRVIDRIKGGGLVFSYYPDHRWLTSSPFLGRCSAPAREARTPSRPHVAGGVRVAHRVPTSGSTGARKGFSGRSSSG